MNILPKKRWHVRTKENIARVRRDEAKAAEEEKARRERANLAEKEARRQLLLQRSRSRFKTEDCVALEQDHHDSKIDSKRQFEHVNIFKELEEGTAELKKGNAEHDKEIKEEKEKYEKQIGYLTYLGQDTNEALGKKSWYECAPDRSHTKAEINLKSKQKEDPLFLIKKLAGEHEKRLKAAPTEKEKFKEYKSLLQKTRKHKHHRNSEEREYTSSEKKLKLQKLRAERLKREKEERKRSDELIAKIKGDKKEPRSYHNQSRYNSQFNPELAKQNFSRN
ncbi:hypothetical protein ABEB36_000480 [Hypothenemus hampei]|uniref:CBF1-interacting co-repressor CIR N-terminal domain-containing protein n=1 Tax=Hypothenemus hampei TaxID=57062 RepID=A0ABD1FBE8_HYPHA